MLIFIMEYHRIHDNDLTWKLYIENILLATFFVYFYSAYMQKYICSSNGT